MREPAKMLDRRFVNRILWCDCLRGMRALPDCCIPLTLTSPPYDDLYLYGGHPFDFETIAADLFRVTMVGGVVVWIVQEQIVDGSETGTSSRQRLFFQELGFRLHHTMVMYGHGTRHHYRVRYGGSLQYGLHSLERDAKARQSDSGPPEQASRPHKKIYAAIPKWRACAAKIVYDKDLGGAGADLVLRHGPAYRGGTVHTSIPHGWPSRLPATISCLGAVLGI